MAERYTALELISVFDAAFLWYDKDPCEKLYGYGLHGWIVLLTRDSDVRDLAFTLLFEIERGSMEVAHSSWLTDVPDPWKSRLGTIPGGRDPRGTMITVSTLAKFAAKRGHKPKCLAHLIADPQTHTGACCPAEFHASSRTGNGKATSRREFSSNNIRGSAAIVQMGGTTPSDFSGPAAEDDCKQPS